MPVHLAREHFDHTQHPGRAQCLIVRNQFSIKGEKKQPDAARQFGPRNNGVRARQQPADHLQPIDFGARHAIRDFQGILSSALFLISKVAFIVIRCF
ncbi:MAG: hypothetical protein C5B44_04490 [Acidobacteria bacterium]|nr:MAG: hypothetical protein C5B44_04490 [Acidobacteriota bacterium]